MMNFGGHYYMCILTRAKQNFFQIPGNENYEILLEGFYGDTTRISVWLKYKWKPHCHFMLGYNEGRKYN